MERVYLGVILHLLVFHQSVCVQFPSFPSAEKQRLSEGCQCAVIRYQRERERAGWQVAHPPDVRDQYPTTRIRGRFPRVFGDKFGEEFCDKFGDEFSESPNLVMN